MSDFEYDDDEMTSSDNLAYADSSSNSSEESDELDEAELFRVEHKHQQAGEDDDGVDEYRLRTVEYQSVDTRELLQSIHAEVAKFSGVLNIDSDDCFILLELFNWNGEKLMEQYMDNWGATREKAGLFNSEGPSGANSIQVGQRMTCAVCCDDKTTWFAMPCQHRYCADCYIYYVKEKVSANARLIQCMEPSCRLNLRLEKDIKVISEYMLAEGITADVRELEEAKRAAEELAQREQAELSEWSDDDGDAFGVSAGAMPQLQGASFARLKSKTVPEVKSLLERYEDGSIKTYVGAHSNYKWCPSPDCRGVASLKNITKSHLKEMAEKHKNNFIPIVSCPHGHSFCFSCNFENHVPAPCWITKAWVQKCKDDSETANWINANTQSCPKCDSSIEKNGGCNHMTCKKCKYEFCWICMGAWSKHGTSFYNCSMFKNVDTAGVRQRQAESKRSLKRYLHFYNHFTAQEQSLKGDNLFCANIETKLMRLQEDLKNEVSWIELQFYKDSVDTLLRCRRTLKWSYALVYYLEENNFQTILTDNQLHLSNSVEKLSKLFEIFQPKQILSKKMDFNSVSGYLLKREKAFIECAIEGITKGELRLVVDDPSATF